MVIFLRTQDNKDLAECEINRSSLEGVDLSCAIHIKNYSIFLLENVLKAEKTITLFDDLSQIRGIYFEHLKPRYIPGGDLSDLSYDYTTALNFVRHRFGAIASMYNLSVVED